MQDAVLPLIAARRPQAIMLQAGADALHEDPLAKLSLSNNAYRAVVQAVMPLAPRLVVLGGGGYNPWTVGRCWALIWGTLNNHPIPDRLPPAGRGRAARPALRPRGRPQSAGALDDHTARRASPRAGSRRGAEPDQGEPVRMKRRSSAGALPPPRCRSPLLGAGARADRSAAGTAEGATGDRRPRRRGASVRRRDGAATPEQQTVGEMFRTSVPADGGMLFDWGFPKSSQMWMRNTLVPLDMVFINPDGTIRSIAENTTPRSLAVIDSRGPVRAVLELPGGTTAKLDIRVGDTVKQRIFGNAQ